MRILIDITHPAHVHFFRNAMEIWKERGDQIAITARKKDIAIDLLERYGYEYEVLSDAGRGLKSLAKELIFRNYKLWRYTREFKPDVMAAIGGIYIAHVGTLTGIPSVVFTDTENATLSNKLTFPFTKHIVTPDCFEVSVPPSKHIQYAGYHELAYTHPRRFTPDPQVLSNFGLTPNEDFILLRIVSWGAVHDVSDSGFQDVVAAVNELKRFGRVLISAEGELAPELEQYRVSVAPELIHHVLYYARLIVGESATMASEAATLGTPAIFISTSTRGYTNEQESKYGLVFTFSDRQEAQQQGLNKALEILEKGPSRDEWRARRETLLNDKIDVTDFIIETIDKAAKSS